MVQNLTHPDEVFRDPDEVVRHLTSSGVIHGLVDMSAVYTSSELVVFWLTLEPWAPMAARGYPTERVTVTVIRPPHPKSRLTPPIAIPAAPDHRTWKHRNASAAELAELGNLCLWYPGDPRPLRWEWDDGLAAFITIVHRHLQAEEYARRNGCWPVEDAPHGEGEHPIQSVALRRIVQEADL